MTLIEINSSFEEDYKRGHHLLLANREVWKFTGRVNVFATLVTL
jgi:hypothetical protein